jgi:hypothetical protein
MRRHSESRDSPRDGGVPEWSQTAVEANQATLINNCRTQITGMSDRDSRQTGIVQILNQPITGLVHQRQVTTASSHEQLTRLVGHIDAHNSIGEKIFKDFAGA